MLLADITEERKLILEHQIFRINRMWFGFQQLHSPSITEIDIFITITTMVIELQIRKSVVNFTNMAVSC